MELAKYLWAEVEQDLADLKRVHGGAPSLARALAKICSRVEKSGGPAKVKGADKRAVAIDLAVLALQKYVPAGWLGWLPEPALRWVLGRAIDGVVAAFKKTGKWAA